MKSRTFKSAAKTVAPVRDVKKLRPRGAKAVTSRHFGLAENIRVLTSRYSFSERDLAGILDVNKRTITRWKAQNGRKSLQQIDRIDVLQSILNLGKRVLGSENAVKLWLDSPVFSLEGQRPRDLIKTESGRRRVENVLLQIEGGVY